MFFYTKKIIISLTTISIILSGCGGGGGASNNSSTTTSPTSTSTPTSTPTKKAIQMGRIKDMKTAKGLANVKVTIGNYTTTTDTNGFYKFLDLTAAKEVTVSFEKDGYLIGSKKVELRVKSEDNKISTNYVEYDLYQHDYNYVTEENIDSRRIFVDIGDLVDKDGKANSGPVFVNLTILDSTERAFLKSFPGNFKGKNKNNETVKFVSYGMININIKNSSAKRLYLRNDDVATLVFHVPSSEKAQIIPLWYYDKEKGIWIEDGYAQRQDNGTYKGEISHLGLWSMNRPIEDLPAIYTDRVLYPDGTPVKNLRVYAIGKNWKSADLSTDENGVFKIEVVPGEEFGLEVYHYSDKYAAKFNGTIPALIAGETVNKIQ